MLDVIPRFDSVPVWLPPAFIALTLGTLLTLRACFFSANISRGHSKGISNRNANLCTTAIAFWLILIGSVAASGFFLNWEARPPRFLLMIIPAMIAIYTLIRSKTLSFYLEKMNGAWLVGIQVFRLGVEMCFVALYKNGALPQIMTFEGRNWDILVGISAPVVLHLAYFKKILPMRTVVLWNVIGFFIICTTVAHGILSTPTFGVISPDLPNAIMGYFPFSWVPGFLAPLAILLHLLSIKEIMLKQLAVHSKSLQSLPRAAD